MDSIEEGRGGRQGGRLSWKPNAEMREVSRDPWFFHVLDPRHCNQISRVIR